MAKLIGVPTTDAVLIKDGNCVHVGIEYKSDFQRVSGDDFLGTEVYEKSDVPFYVNGNIHKPSIITEAKYPDDDPMLGEFMAYLAFRNLIVLEDNPQILPENPVQLSLRAVEDLRSLERNPAFRVRLPSREQAADAHARHSLAASALSDQSQDIPFFHGKRDPVDCKSLRRCVMKMHF